MSGGGRQVYLQGRQICYPCTRFQEIRNVGKRSRALEYLVQQEPLRHQQELSDVGFQFFLGSVRAKDHQAHQEAN